MPSVFGKCDCCHSDGRFNYYDHNSFIVTLPLLGRPREVLFEGGQWAFCPECEQLFFAGKLNELAERAATLQEMVKSSNEPKEMWVALFTDAYQKLRHALTKAA